MGRWLLGLALVWFVHPHPALAASQTVDDALEPVRMQLRLKNFALAAQLLNPLATQGNASAEALLANLYFNGLGVAEDATQGKSWLERAATHGNSEAMYQLATLSTDQTVSQQWLEKAARQAHPLATAALHEGIAPQRFQPDKSLQDAISRKHALLLAAAHDDVQQLKAFADLKSASVADDFGRTALSYAVRYGAAHTTQWLLESGADANHADHFGITPLMLAATQGNDTLLQPLLAAHAHSNAQDQAGNNALMHAIAGGHTVAVNVLLPVTDIKQRNTQNWTVLDWAIHDNQTDLAQQLRGMGLSSSRKAVAVDSAPIVPIQHASSGDLYQGWPDILIASTRPNAALFDAVSVSNANATRGNETALLMSAVQSGNSALIDKLLARGKPGDADNETPLSWAVRHGDIAIVQLLLAKGIQPDTHGRSETVPLLDAIRLSQASARVMVDALLKAGANPDSRDALGRTALMISAQIKRDDLIERLLQSGANASFTDKNGYSALMHAAQVGSAAGVRLFVGEKSSVDGRDNLGNNALLLAAARGHATVVDALVAAGASLQANTHGDTPLMLAAAEGQEAIIKKLLNVGSKVDAQNKHGDTALILAARAGQLSAVRALLAAGADALLRNNDRASARDVADKLAFREISAVLNSRS